MNALMNFSRLKYISVFFLNFAPSIVLFSLTRCPVLLIKISLTAWCTATSTLLWRYGAFWRCGQCYISTTCMALNFGWKALSWCDLTMKSFYTFQWSLYYAFWQSSDVPVMVPFVPLSYIRGQRSTEFILWLTGAPWLHSELLNAIDHSQWLAFSCFLT